MVNIEVHRYPKYEVDGVKSAGHDWQGYIQPADRSWIVFVRADGTPIVNLHPDPKAGASPPEPPSGGELTSGTILTVVGGCPTWAQVVTPVVEDAKNSE